ncbi:hypothetical protein COCMIDRAFT_98983, partial [Bipolaris oryzae ATCC 44560]
WDCLWAATHYLAYVLDIAAIIYFEICQWCEFLQRFDGSTTCGSVGSDSN